MDRFRRSHNFPYKPQPMTKTAIYWRHFVDLEESPTQHPYPVYSIDSSVHAEIQCQLTIKRKKEEFLSDFRLSFIIHFSSHTKQRHMKKKIL